MIRFGGGSLAYDVRTGVFRFTGRDGGKVVQCSMSEEALAAISGISVCAIDAIPCFNDHEAVIFGFTARKYARYGCDEGGQLILTTLDVVGSTES